MRRFSPHIPFVAGLVVAACSAAGPAGSSPSQAAPTRVVPAPTPVSADVALLTFDSAWSRIYTTYYDSTFRGLDWHAVGDSLRPRAAAATTLRELRGVITQMLARLGESHFAVIPRETADAFDDGVAPASRPEADIGVELRWIDGELTVFRLDPGSAADAGVQRGWIIDAIDGRDVADWQSSLATAENPAALEALKDAALGAAMNRMRGLTGSQVSVRFRTADDDTTTLELERRPLRGEPVRFGNLPLLFAWLEQEALPLPDGSCAGMIRINVWMTQLSQPFNRAVDALSHCAGFIIDLRGNPGGVGGMVMGTAGSFYDEMVPLAIVRARGSELRFVAIPRRVTEDGRRRETFRGPVAILVDERSASTSEIFAAGLQRTGRARVFGSPTPGQALPAVTLRLPTGDVLYHAVADLRAPDGARIEGAGVVPDVIAPPTRDALLAGRDPAMEAAAAWIAQTAAEPPASRN